MRVRLVCLAIAVAMASPCSAAEENKGKHREARRATATSSAPTQDSALADARSEVYKKVGGVDLKIYFFMPPGHKPTDKAPAILFFFGGGWLGGSPGQFVPQCKYLASRGMVAGTADYRVFNRHKALVADCVADAESAMRWARANAGKLGIDPDRIASSGGSAGGHLAAAVGMLDDLTDDEDKSVSFRPNAMILFNPAIDLTSDDPAEKHRNLVKRLGAKAADLSPADHIKPGLAPTIIFHGKNDVLIPFSKIEEFARTMRAAGNKCEAVGFEGQGHGFFNPGRSDNLYFHETLRMTDRFLASLGWLRGEPTLDTKVSATQPSARVHPNFGGEVR